MAIRTISWPAVTTDDVGQPVTVDEYRVYLDGAVLPNYTVPAPGLNQNHDFPAGSSTLVEVSAVSATGEGARASTTHVEASGIPAAPGSVSVT